MTSSSERPTSQDSLADLIARLEAATGPDRELDAHVCRVLFHGQLTTIKPGWYSNASHVHIEAPRITADIRAAWFLVEQVLPGWWITCGLCTVTGHASIGPDYLGPHRERLLREFPQDIFDHGGFDADLSPGDGIHRTCFAIIHCLLQALAKASASPETEAGR